MCFLVCLRLQASPKSICLFFFFLAKQEQRELCSLSQGLPMFEVQPMGSPPHRKDGKAPRGSLCLHFSCRMSPPGDSQHTESPVPFVSKAETGSQASSGHCRYSKGQWPKHLLSSCSCGVGMGRYLPGRDFCMSMCHSAWCLAEGPG